MLTITDLLPQDAIIVDDALTTGASLPTFMHLRDRYAYFGNVSGGIGWAIAAAVGIQLAQPERKVVALLGDGSAMYSIQALWTAAHQKLPMVFVVFNNGGYRIIKQRLKLFHSTERYIGMDFVDPPIDFAALARSLGMRAHRIDTGDEFGAAYRDALAAREPVLLEVIVDGRSRHRGSRRNLRHGRHPCHGRNRRRRNGQTRAVDPATARSPSTRSRSRARQRPRI